VTVGSAATFTCTATEECSEPRLNWLFAAVVDRNFEYRYLNCKRSVDVMLMAPKCSITLSNNNRTSSLTVDDVQLRNAGAYKCAACWNHGASKTKAVSKLSVIGKKWKFVHVLAYFLC